MKESKMKESKQLMSELLTVSQIFKDRLFRIPDYQRGYAWEERQIEDLIKDITHISGKDHKHYTGSIVVAWNEAAGRFDIVDGQQRITTLIILLNEIKRRNSSRFVEAEHTFINRGNGVFVLELNAESNNFFKEAILDDRKGFTMDIKSLQNLNAAKEFLSRWVDENADRLDSIYHTITEKLGFLCFAPERNEEIGIMFEVINNRGKALSELEKIKNYFIYYSTIYSDGALKNKNNSTEIVQANDAELIEILGLELRNLSSRERNRLQTNGIKVISVRKGSIVDATNMRPDFIITRVNNQKVGSTGQLVSALRKAAGSRVTLRGFYEGDRDPYYYVFNLQE